VSRIIGNNFNKQGFRICFWGSGKGFKEGSGCKDNLIRKIKTSTVVTIYVLISLN
jgi:hypothetical protein